MWTQLSTSIHVFPSQLPLSQPKDGPTAYLEAYSPTVTASDSTSTTARTRSPRDPKPLVQKDGVHVLKAASRGLGIEQPGDGHENRIEDSPDDVEAIPEALDGLRGDVDDGEVGEPVGGGAESDAFVAGAEGHYFRGVHPGDGEDAEGEGVEEEEGEGDEEPLGLAGGGLLVLEFLRSAGEGRTGDALWWCLGLT